MKREVVDKHCKYDLFHPTIISLGVSLFQLKVGPVQYCIHWTVSYTFSMKSS